MIRVQLITFLSIPCSPFLAYGRKLRCRTTSRSTKIDPSTAGIANDVPSSQAIENTGFLSIIASTMSG
jgi:hypothetical protein